MATHVIPREAGPIVFHMRKIRTLRIVLVIATIGILLGIGLSDRKLLPVVGMIAAMCGLIGTAGALVTYFVTKLYALCENGCVTKRRSTYRFIPWSDVIAIERLTHRGHVNFAIATRNHRLVFSPGALGNDRTIDAVSYVQQCAKIRLAQARPGF